MGLFYIQSKWAYFVLLMLMKQGRMDSKEQPQTKKASAKGRDTFKTTDPHKFGIYMEVTLQARTTQPLLLNL
jgi:hypothetical protein